jgi:hypothetical protein
MPPTPRRIRLFARSVIGSLTAAAGFLAGCNRDEVRVYDAPKSSMAGESAATAPAAATGGDTTSEVGGLKYLVPAGWKEDKRPRQMRETTMTIGEGAKSAEVVVSKLGRDNVPLVQQVTRWRGRVGLPPPADNDVAAAKVTVDGQDASLFDFAGPDSKAPARRLVQVVAPHGEAVYYVKIEGDAEVVAAQKAAFDRFLASIHFKG